MTTTRFYQAMVMALVVVWIVPAAASASREPPAQAPSEPRHVLETSRRSGETVRIVVAGSTTAHAMRHHGYFETALHASFPQADIRLRHLAWEGDTVYERHRMPNFPSFQEEIRERQPDLLLLQFGFIEAFDGPNRLPGFIRAYRELLGAVRPEVGTAALVGPIDHERRGKPLPAVAEHRSSLRLYNAAIEQLAADQNVAFVDLLADSGREPLLSSRPWTHNGVMLTPYGHWAMALTIAKQLELAPAGWELRLSPDSTDPAGVDVADLHFSSEQLTFALEDQGMAYPAFRKAEPAATASEYGRLTVEGLKPGGYMLRVNGEPIAFGTHTDWAAGVKLEHGMVYDRTEQLRQAVVEKNRLFALYWRPPNWDFGYGERTGVPFSRDPKEQARRVFRQEHAEYPSIIEGWESRIAKLAGPWTDRYELTRIAPKREEGSP